MGCYTEVSLGLMVRVNYGELLKSFKNKFGLEEPSFDESFVKKALKDYDIMVGNSYDCSESEDVTLLVESTRTRLYTTWGCENDVTDIETLVEKAKPSKEKLETFIADFKLTAKDEPQVHIKTMDYNWYWLSL